MKRKAKNQKLRVSPESHIPLTSLDKEELKIFGVPIRTKLGLNHHDYKIERRRRKSKSGAGDVGKNCRAS